MKTMTTFVRYPPQPMGAKETAELALIREHFELRGFDAAGELSIFRRKTGKPTKQHFNKRLKRYQTSEWIEGRVKTFKVARIIFGLVHGWLPKIVDHEDRVPTNDAIDNLRPATRSQNMWNGGSRKRPKHPHLPMGVERTKSGKYRAYIKFDGKRRHIGVFDDEEVAREAYNQAKRALRGEEWAVRTFKGRRASLEPKGLRYTRKPQGSKRLADKCGRFGSLPLKTTLK